MYPKRDNDNNNGLLLAVRMYDSSRHLNEAIWPTKNTDGRTDGRLVVVWCYRVLNSIEEFRIRSGVERNHPDGQNKTPLSLSPTGSSSSLAHIIEYLDLLPFSLASLFLFYSPYKCSGRF